MTMVAGNAAVYHRRKSGDWATPQTFFDTYHAEFGFTLDAAAQPHNAKCARFFTPEQDGLTQDWSGEVVWCNPPYGRVLREWVRKGYDESRRGATVVLLVPARTDSAWFHDYAMKGEVRFVRGRLWFEGAPYNSPFSSIVVVFRP